MQKIIASTDESLGLPLIQSEFVKLYCEFSIEEFFVEYELNEELGKLECECGIEKYPNACHPKVEEDNTVIIYFESVTLK